jgi:hypothetical protein
VGGRVPQRRPGPPGRPAHVQGAGAADRLRAQVAVEARQDRLGDQPQLLDDGLDLEAERRLPLAEAVAEQHPGELAAPQGLQAAAQEQPHPGRGVRRVAEDQVEPAQQAARQLHPQVGEDRADPPAALAGDRVDVAEDPLVQVDDGDLHRGGDVQQGQGGQVVVAEAEHAGAAEVEALGQEAGAPGGGRRGGGHVVQVARRRRQPAHDGRHGRRQRVLLGAWRGQLAGREGGRQRRHRRRRGAGAVAAAVQLHPGLQPAQHLADRAAGGGGRRDQLAERVPVAVQQHADQQADAPELRPPDGGQLVAGAVEVGRHPPIVRPGVATRRRRA